MPERPKRRKNNKNKRKNKNNRPENNNKSSSDTKILDDSESGKSRIDDEDDTVEPDVIETIDNETKTVEGEVVEFSKDNNTSVNATVGTSSNADTLIGDLNNNNNPPDSNVLASTAQIASDASDIKVVLDSTAQIHPNVTDCNVALESTTQIASNVTDSKDVVDFTAQSTSNAADNNVVLDATDQIASDAVQNSTVKITPAITDTTDSVVYVVEPPEQSLNCKTKLQKVKSKSLDSDDATNIVEVTEDDVHPGNDSALALIDSQNVVITHVDSDVEWEKTDELNNISVPQCQELATGTLSITTIPLTVAQCGQNKTLTPDEEKSLRSYLKTLNLVTQPENVNTIEIKTEIEQIINQEIKQRLRKKGLADDFFLHRLGPPRILDVIDEEGSSESSMTSRRQSYLSDKKSDIEDLEDDVFEDKNKSVKQKYQTSTVSSIHKSANVSNIHKKTIGQLVPQECMLVGAKLKEPEVTEARGEWTMKTVEKMTGAEVVYLTDTSSSSSSLHEIGDDDDGVDTDVSVRMITPTIEVTDTENFLKKTFITTNQDNERIIPIEYSQNNKAINEMNEKDYQQINIKKNERIVPIKREENTEKADKSRILSDSIAEIKNVKERNENYQHMTKTETISGTNTIENVCKSDSKENDQIGRNERIIKIDIEKEPIKNRSDIESDITQICHEIVVLSTDDIKTNLYVKDIDEPENTRQKNEANNKKDILPDISSTGITESHTTPRTYDLETKVIKCEFNDAINNLIKEVSSDSEGVNENPKDTFSRQDSSSSVDSSQCTAKYNPNYESLNDISNIVHDEISMHNKSTTEQTSSTKSHVKDVFQCVAGSTSQNKVKIEVNNTDQPLRLRDLCVRNIASLPYGDKILEELASVSKRLQNFTALGANSHTINKDQGEDTNNTSMPHYRLPDVSTIDAISIPTKVKDPVPPPVKPRRSSLKKSHDEEHWTGIQTKSEPVYVCLSPSQKMLMDKTNTVITKEDATHLVDMHRKYVDRRGYNELYKNEKQNDENDLNNPPIVPFKSQTGSRLLALIRDPTLTRNINSLNDRLNNSLDELQTKRTVLTTYTKNNQDRLNSTRNYSFKPIPPPRPKKYSSSFYESDESSDFTDNSMRSMKSERKYFHYSTGNLNKEIENDISSIQNMHRFFTDTRDNMSEEKSPRRPSLPKDLCEQQMEYIRKKEKEVEAEIQRLEALKDNISPIQRKGPRAPLISEKEVIDEHIKDSNNYSISRKKDVMISTPVPQNNRKGKMSSLFSSSQEELLREKMYSEYVTQMAEREERKQHKVIKITNTPDVVNSKISKSMPTLDAFDSKINNRIEKEFISKARERWDKLGIRDPETEDERESANNVYKEPKVIEHKIKVIEGGKEKDVKKLPSHLQEFVRFTAKDTEQATGSSGESESGPATPHLVIMCAVIIIVIAVGKYFLRMLRFR